MPQQGQLETATVSLETSFPHHTRRDHTVVFNLGLLPFFEIVLRAVSLAHYLLFNPDSDPHSQFHGTCFLKGACFLPPHHTRTTVLYMQQWPQDVQSMEVSGGGTTAAAEDRMSQYRISRTLGVGSFGKVPSPIYSHAPSSAFHAGEA